jgi:hypothetical protein
MIIRVELHSAVIGQITEIERARIANIGRSETLGNYATETLRGPCAEDLNKGIVQRSSFIEKHPRKGPARLASGRQSSQSHGGMGNEETFNRKRADRYRCRATARDIGCVLACRWCA